MIPGPANTAALDRLVALPRAARAEVLARMSDRDAAVIGEWLTYDWSRWARPKQIPPAGTWRYCVVLAGRSWGKTLAGAQEVRRRAEGGRDPWVSLCGPTMTTVLRDMVGGPSGLMTISPPWFRPVYQPSRAQVVYPAHPVTGIRTRVALLSADRPERIRGSQGSFAWFDEPQSWSKAEEALEMLDLTLRLGQRPQAVVTMTPRPNEVTRRLVLGPKGEDGQRRLSESTVVVRGSTFENKSLSREVLAELRRTYEGTRLGRQELHAELLDRPERQLFTEDTIESARLNGVPCAIVRVVLAIDPSRSRFGAGDMAGGCVVGLGEDAHLYVLADASIRGTPRAWIEHFASVFNLFRVDLGIFESTGLDAQIVDLLRAEFRGQHWESRSATGRKALRLEPVAAAAEAGRIHFSASLPELEEQLVSFDPTEPKGQLDDRVDAFGAACRELLGASTRTGLRLLL